MNHFFELARERGVKVARACEPASVRLSLQAMRLSYFKNSNFTPSLQRNRTLRVSSLSKLFYKYKFPCCLCAARSLISVCNNVCVCVYESSVASAYSFGLATNPSRARSYPLNINPNPTRNLKVFWDLQARIG